LPYDKLENGLMVINYKMPSTTEYRSFMDNVAAQSKDSYKDRRLAPYKNFSVTSASQVLAILTVCIFVLIGRNID